MQPKSRGLLSPFQQELLLRFFTLDDSSHFYLTGGTALAEYYLGHRKSFDLNLFTGEKELIVPFSRTVESGYGELCRVTVIRRFATFAEFEMEGDESVRMQVAFDSPFRIAAPVVVGGGIAVNDYLDLAVDKLLAFFGRSEPRDAVDIHFILKNTSLAKLGEMAERKDSGFDPYWLAVAFSRIQDFPDEISRWPVEMTAAADAREIKKEFVQLAKRIMDSIRPESR